MKKNIYIGVAVAAAVGIAAWLLTGDKKEGGVIYGTAVVEKKDIATSVTATGTLEPVTSVTVGTQVSGIVDKLYVDYNSIVKKGQVIAELDKTNLLSELASTKAQLASAQSTLAYEKSNYERYKTLFNKGLVSATDYESARLSYEKAVQSVRTANETVKKAETNLGDLWTDALRWFAVSGKINEYFDEDDVAAGNNKVDVDADHIVALWNAGGLPHRTQVL